jgi:hypothetical protein
MKATAAPLRRLLANIQESAYPRHPRAGSSAVEHVTFNHVVEGSIPSRLTNEFRDLMRVLISGVGNVLKGDDGCGVRALELLKGKDDLPANVTMIETGIEGIHLVQELGQGHDALILLDAMEAADRREHFIHLVEPFLLS